MERESNWSKGVIWGVPVGVSMDEIKSNLRGILKGVRQNQIPREGVRKEKKRGGEKKRKVSMLYLILKMNSYPKKWH